MRNTAILAGSRPECAAADNRAFVKIAKDQYVPVTTSEQRPVPLSQI
jgi:hypothetical protein